MNSGKRIHNRARSNVITSCDSQVVRRQIRIVLQSYLDMTSTRNNRVRHPNGSLYGIGVNEMCAIVENICTTGFNIIENALKWSISVQKEMFLGHIMDL